MIEPAGRKTDYLEFRCDQCGEVFHEIRGIIHDGPDDPPEKRYDVRGWIVARFFLECPKCRQHDEYKVRLLSRGDIPSGF